ncbi:MAG: HDOD domain-containing protein, partial [Gammaproteobacteria bacterium]
MSQAQRHTMPHSTAPPHSAHGETTTAITHWFQSIKDVALPILPLTHHALQRQWLRSHGALNQLADIIAQDPVASLAVLRAANSTHPMHSTSEAIIGIHHCITYLGLENLQHLIAKTPILTASITQSSYVHYVNSLVRGLYAAFLAQDWARAQNHYQPEQLFLSALFYNAPYWALWRVAPAEMKIIEHLKLNEHIPAQEAETVVLGTSIAPLAATLAKYWRLPSVIQAAYDHTQLPHIKTILKAGQCCAKGQLGTWPNFDNHGVATHSTAVHVLLANWIAFESEISWHSRQLQRVTALASAFQHQSTARGQRGLWQQALAVSRAYALPNTSSPGSRLMTPRHTPTRRTRSPEHVMAYVKKLLTQRDTLATDTPVTASADQAIKNDIDTAYTAATTASHSPSPSRSHTPASRTPASRTPASQTPTSQTSSVNPPAATKPPLNTSASANIKDSQLFKDLYTR